MRIAIVGSGLIGGKLGTVFARAGHDVVFSYSRSQHKLDQLARDAGHGARAGTVAEAVAHAELVLIAVHWSRLDEILTQAGPFAGKLVVTCSLPMNEDDSQLVIGHTSSGAETLAAKLPGVAVVSAFGTIPSEVVNSVFEARASGAPSPDLVYCGDDGSAKQAVAGLIRDVGFNPVDLGALALARYIEPFALLVAKIAYEVSDNPVLAYRFQHLAEEPALDTPG